jgi:hypothetical protein
MAIIYGVESCSGIGLDGFLGRQGEREKDEFFVRGKISRRELRGTIDWVREYNRRP